MAADFGLSNFLEDVPQINLGGLFPSTPFLPGEPPHAPIIVNAPRAQQALTNKYSTYMRDISGRYPPEVVQALMDYDSRRVQSGQTPLSQTETIKVLDTALNKRAATPEPRRKIGPTSILANAVKDIGDIVTALPRLPFALAHEATQIGTMGEGSNPIQRVLNAPGIRLIPGTFVASNILGGTPGELARHPVVSLLDVLPAAEKLAAATPVATRVADLAETARRAGSEVAPHAGLSTREFNLVDRLAQRPISTAINWRLSDEGVPIRSGAGQFVDNLRKSKLGSFLSQHFGQESRNLMFGINRPVADMNSLLDGTRPPEDALEAVAKAAHDVNNKVAAIDPAFTSPGKMAELYDRMLNGDFANMTDAENAAVQVYQEALDGLTTWALDNGKNIEFGGEIYDMQSGLKLLQAQRLVSERTIMNRVRGAVLTGDANEALSVLSDRLTAPGKRPGVFGYRTGPLERSRQIQAGAISPKEMMVTWRGANQALKNAGLDTRTLEALVRKHGLGSVEVRTAIEDIRAGKIELPPAPMMSETQVRARLEELVAQGSTGARDALRGINLREWKGVTESLDLLRKESPEFIRGLRNLRDTDRMVRSSSFVAASEEAVAQATRAFERVRQENLAARFLPRQQQIVRDLVSKELIKEQDLLPITERVSVDAILRARDAGELAGIPGFTPEMYNMARREATKTIQEMIAQGFNPMFVHTVPVNRVSQSVRFTENIVPHTPASMRERVADLTPGVRNMSIAINDMGMQFLNEPLQEARVKWVADNYGYTIHEVNALTHEEARYAAGESEAFNYEGHKAAVINRRFRKLDPDEMGLGWGSPYVNQLKTEAVYVPIEVYRNLKALADNSRFFGGVMDPVTKTFRIATTALSLRTQIYNIVGGAVATELMHPGAIAKYGSEARAMLADPAAIPRDFAAVIGSSERTMLELDRQSRGIVVEGVRKYLVGKKLREAWDAAQARKAVEGGPFTTLGNKVNGLVKKSYHFNAVFDNFYRAVTYLAEHDDLLSKGYPDEFARYHAVGASRRVLQDYLGMTPFERNVVKSLIPFYGFLSHAIRFVLRYPFDHPLRTEFMAKAAMAEMERDDTLPNRFMSMLFFGHPDSHGNRHAFNLAPFNPFGDVANSMTLAGFLGNMNPIMQTAFEMVGLDRGQAELYPSLRYNPDTGRMEASREGFLETALGNVIPQSGLLLAFAGLNTQYNEMLRRDPDQAARYLLGTLTVPIVERQVNVPQEMFAAELAREKSATATLNAALKSGNWSEAMLYPSLQSYLDAVEKLTPEQLAPFQARPREDIEALAQQAFSGQVMPQTQPTSLDDLIAAQQQVAPLPTEGVNPLSGLVGAGPLGLNGI